MAAGSTPAAFGTHRIRLWCRRQGSRDRAIAASALALLLLVLFLTAGPQSRQPALARSQSRQPALAGSHSREPALAGSQSREPALVGLQQHVSDSVDLPDGSQSREPSLDVPPQIISDLVDLTLLSNAEEKGAVCLDGSPAGYHLQRGYGSGSDGWVVFLEGGGWCRSLEDCSFRKQGPFGSTRYMERQDPFFGILSSNRSQNPDFYNWNKVKVRYCDGASFSGDAETEMQDGTKLFFRGQRIWEAVIGELLLKGLAKAKQALLTGCSAGGLATFLHCDDFQAFLPKEVTVKCLADAGLFLDVQDISKKRSMRSYYNGVVHLQNVGKNLHHCPSNMEPSQCFFPGEIIKSIRTPLFIVNAAYDSWQVQCVLTPHASDNSHPQRSWQRCRLNIETCDSNQMESLQGFRDDMLNTLSEFKHRSNGGMFIHSCFAHCQTVHHNPWHSPHSPRINNKTIAEAVGDWFFNRRVVKEIDPPFRSNPTCENLIIPEPWC